MIDQNAFGLWTASALLVSDAARLLHLRPPESEHLITFLDHHRPTDLFPCLRCLHFQSERHEQPKTIMLNLVCYNSKAIWHTSHRTCGGRLHRALKLNLQSILKNCFEIATENGRKRFLIWGLLSSKIDTYSGKRKHSADQFGFAAFFVEIFSILF
jgi:hypothetical protein